jgi:CheY-like chemotaxis protein
MPFRFAPTLTGDPNMARTVLLVSTDREQLTARERALEPLADKVYVASNFPEAKSILIDAKPDVLVTDLRLHEFNGTHLALWSRVRLPHLRSVIIGQTDPSLAADAGALGFDYVQEESAEAIANHTMQALDTELPQRRWPRKRLSFPLSADIDGTPAAILDVGHGGCRIHMAEGALEPNTTFNLRIAEFGVRATATCVWVKALSGPARWCGAVVTEAEMSTAEWRAFVDTLEADAAACVPDSTSV